MRAHQLDDPRCPQPAHRHRRQIPRPVEQGPGADQVLRVLDGPPRPEQVPTARPLCQLTQNRIPGGPGHEWNQPLDALVQQRPVDARTAQIDASTGRDLLRRQPQTGTQPQQRERVGLLLPGQMGGPVPQARQLGRGVGPVRTDLVPHQTTFANSSWLNRIEAQFTALRYFTLDGTDHASHKEQSSMIRRYIIWRNKHAAQDERLREVVNRANVA